MSTMKTPSHENVASVTIEQQQEPDRMTEVDIDNITPYATIEKSSFTGPEYETVEEVRSQVSALAGSKLPSRDDLRGNIPLPEIPKQQEEKKTIIYAEIDISTPANPSKCSIDGGIRGNDDKVVYTNIRPLPAVPPKPLGKFSSVLGNGAQNGQQSNEDGAMISRF